MRIQHQKKQKKTLPKSNVAVCGINDPMTYRKEILLGRITKISGYEGAVTVKLEKRFTENIPDMESVFLEIEGRPVPFFISGLEYKGGDILKLRFEGYGSAEKVTGFSHCNVYMTEWIQTADPEEDLQTFIGYKVKSDNNNILGSIKDIMPNSGQWLLKVVTSGENEILIPFHDDLVMAIDNKEKFIIMDIPEGLVNIN
jgi:16S rRNA processing protein RimM